MGASLSLSISVTNTSDTAATVKVTLKVKSTSGSWNSAGQYGYITIDGSKHEFHHKFNKNTTTTLATYSKSVARTTANRSVSVKGYYKTGVSPGNISKSGSASVSARPVYTVYFNANGGSGGGSVGVYSGYTTTFPYTSRAGYNFSSWNGYAQGAGTPAITSSRTYTAYWTPITYTIAYDLAEGLPPTDSTLPTTYDIEHGFSLGKPTREGYYFLGWTGSNGVTPDGGVEEGNLEVPTGSTGNRNYTANWALNQYTINLKLGEAADAGGSVDPTQLTKTHGVALSLPTPIWNRPFVGWSYNDSNIGSVCNVDGDVNSDEIDLVALWSEEVRPVIYHYWDSATNINSTYQTYKIIDNTLTLPIPRITNYVFKGWYTDSSFSGESITTIPNTYDYPTGDSRYQDPEPIHLYAKWNEEYTVVYNINSPSYDDGIDAETTQDTKISQKFENGVPGTLGNTASYYTYGTGQCTAGHGWSINSGLNNEKTYDDEAQLTISGQPAGYVLNLYAVWNPAQYAFTFRPNISSSEEHIIPVTYYETYQLPEDKSCEWGWKTEYDTEYISNWFYTIMVDGEEQTIRLALQSKVLVKGDMTYIASWIDYYKVPVISGIDTYRYLETDYKAQNSGGKFLKIDAKGTNGKYEGATPYDKRAVTENEGTITYDESQANTYSYDVDVQFYASSDYINEIPVAIYKLPLHSQGDNFNQIWGSADHPLIDKKLNMIYCVLTIIDTTQYIKNGAPVNISQEQRTFTYEFPAPLERAIALHIADDLHAISIMKELKKGDTGLVVNAPMNLQRSWVWDVDPITQVLFLKWGGDYE